MTAEKDRTQRGEGKGLSMVLINCVISNSYIGMRAKGEAFQFHPWKEADVLQGLEAGDSDTRGLRRLIITVGLKALKISFQEFPSWRSG